MFKILRIVFTVLCALCVLPVIFFGVYLNLGGAIVCALVAVLFFMAAAFFKNLQERQETPPQSQTGDFLNPLPSDKHDGSEDKNGEEE